jgi:hypothetical protein
MKEKQKYPDLFTPELESELRRLRVLTKVVKYSRANWRKLKKLNANIQHIPVSRLTGAFVFYDVIEDADYWWDINSKINL